MAIDQIQYVCEHCGRTTLIPNDVCSECGGTMIPLGEPEVKAKAEDDDEALTDDTNDAGGHYESLEALRDEEEKGHEASNPYADLEE